MARLFCEAMRCTPATVVTRIEWEYLPGREMVEQ